MLALAGCSSLQYYFQSISGQMDIWRRERPIEEILADADISVPLKRKLSTVLEIRDFATRELALPDNPSYRSYADLKRDFVAWNVFAAPEFSVRPVRWCFLFVGCVSYRGYFSEAEARRYADGLARKGYDVHVGGVAAYSTLGYFSDPVLSTVMSYSRPRLARLIFHELAHQVVYTNGDTAFNESFAVAVEREGVRRWLEQHGSEQDREAYALGTARRAEFLELVMTYHGRLKALYASGEPPGEMRRRKQALFDEMQHDYRALKARWGGFAGYDRWFEEGLNNARIASVAVYTQHVPAFEALLAQSGGDMRVFYARVRELARREKAERNRILASLATRATREARAQN